MTLPLHVLYALRSWAHFTYHQSTVRELCGSGHRVTAVFDPRWCEGVVSDAPVRAFASERPAFRHGLFAPRTGPTRLPVTFLRELRNYSFQLALSGQSPFYLRRQLERFPRLVRPALRSAPARAFLEGPRGARWLAALEARRKPTQAALDLLEREAPDVVVASPLNHWFSEEVELVKAAKALGIPTVVAVLTWDNLTTKGVYHCEADAFLAWNDTHRDEAIRLHSVPEERITITGSPFFDKWFEPWTPSPFEALAAQAEIPAGKRFALYLGSSSNIAKDETWLVEALAEELSRDEIHLLVRPHPGNAKVYERLRTPHVTVWPKRGNLSTSAEDFQAFRDSLHHSIGAVGINTSGMIDAMCADKPTVSVQVEAYRSTQTDVLHYQHLIDAGVLEVTPSVPAAAEALKDLAAGKDGRASARAAFVRRFVRPQGRDGGVEQARAIERIAIQKKRAP